MTRSLCPRAKLGLVEVATGYAPFRQAVQIDQATGLAVLPSPPRRKINTNEFVFSDLMTHLASEACAITLITSSSILRHSFHWWMRARLESRRTASSLLFAGTQHHRRLLDKRLKASVQS